MSKAQIKRDQIVERLTDFLLAEGLMAASLRPLAAAAGMSDRMLIYYFQDKETIVAATLERAAARFADHLSAMTDDTTKASKDLEAELLLVTASPDLWPYMCLWVELAALAARGDPLFRSVGRRIADYFHQWICARLTIRNPDARSAAALAILARIDGAIVLRSVGFPR